MLSALSGRYSLQWQLLQQQQSPQWEANHRLVNHLALKADYYTNFADHRSAAAPLPHSTNVWIAVTAVSGLLILSQLIFSLIFLHYFDFESIHHHLTPPLLATLSISLNHAGKGGLKGFRPYSTSLRMALSPAELFCPSYNTFVPAVHLSSGLILFNSTSLLANFSSGAPPHPKSLSEIC